jgi:hypothetical protein
VLQKNVVNPSGWIEYFADGLNAEFFEAAILDARKRTLNTSMRRRSTACLIYRARAGKEDRLQVLMYPSA